MVKSQMNSISSISLSWQSQLWKSLASNCFLMLATIIWCVITNCAWLAYSSPQQEQTRLWISTYETLKCYQKKLTAIVSYCLFRGQVMWRYPVQRGEEVSMGFQDGSRALCSLHGEVPRKSIGGGRVCQRQHHVSQRVRHEAGRLLFGGSPGC